MADEPGAGVPGAPPGAAGSGKREGLLRIARDPETDPQVLTMVAREAEADGQVFLALVRNPRTPEQALAHLAAEASPAVLKELAGQVERLRARPTVVQAILANPHTDDSLRVLVAGARREGGAGARARPASPTLAGRDDLLRAARDPQAHEEVLSQVVREAGEDDELLLALVRNPRTPEHALVYAALVGSPAVLKGMADQAERLRARPTVVGAMLENEDLNEGLRARVRATMAPTTAGPAKPPVPLYNLIKGMSTGQRLALAKKGNKEVRMILIKDSNDMVALQVVTSPRITEPEILSIAQMRDVGENVLRTIAANKQRRANKQITWALLNNPKTPLGVVLSLGLGSLSEKELEQLAKNRNVSAALQRAARALLDKKRKPSGGAGHGH